MEELTELESALTPKELLFINYFLSHNLNATLAAKLAGYSEVSAYELGHRLLKKVEVKKVIDQYLKNESLESLELLKRISDTAKNKASAYINDDGSVDLQGLKEDGLMHLVKSITKGKGGRTTVTFYDAQRAQETLAKVHKLVSDNPLVTFNIENKIAEEQKLSEQLSTIRDRLLEHYDFIPKGTN